MFALPSCSLGFRSSKCAFLAARRRSQPPIPPPPPPPPDQSPTAIAGGSSLRRRRRPRALPPPPSLFNRPAPSLQLADWFPRLCCALVPLRFRRSTGPTLRGAGDGRNRTSDWRWLAICCSLKGFEFCFIETDCTYMQRKYFVG